MARIQYDDDHHAAVDERIERLEHRVKLLQAIVDALMRSAYLPDDVKALVEEARRLA